MAILLISRTVSAGQGDTCSRINHIQSYPGDAQSKTPHPCVRRETCSDVTGDKVIQLLIPMKMTDHLHHWRPYKSNRNCRFVASPPLPSPSLGLPHDHPSLLYDHTPIRGIPQAMPAPSGPDPTREDGSEIEATRLHLESIWRSS